MKAVRVRCMGGEGTDAALANQFDAWLTGSAVMMLLLWLLVDTAAIDSDVILKSCSAFAS